MLPTVPLAKVSVAVLAPEQTEVVPEIVLLTTTGLTVTTKEAVGAVQEPTVDTARKPVEALNAPVSRVLVVPPVMLVHVGVVADQFVDFCQMIVPVLPDKLNEVPDAALLKHKLSLNPLPGFIVPETGVVTKNLTLLLYTELHAPLVTLARYQVVFVIAVVV